MHTKRQYKAVRYYDIQVERAKAVKAEDADCFSGPFLLSESEDACKKYCGRSPGDPQYCTGAEKNRAFPRASQVGGIDHGPFNEVPS
ncbi:hypothetical protein ES703_123420 [subsurface metagenome]